MSVIKFPFERSLQRADEPMCYDSEHRLMRPYACSYMHQGKEIGLTIWAYDFADADARIQSIQQTLTVAGCIVASGTGEFNI